MVKGRNREKKIDVKALIALDRYLTILLEAYPTPINATDLAYKARKSKPAISKIRDRLLQVCDVNSMLFKKGFVLSSETQSIQSLFLVFASTGRHRKFLSSKLVQNFISRKAIHPKIVRQYPLYDKYFNEDDTAFIFTKLLDAIARIDPQDLEEILKTYVFASPSLFSSHNLPDLSKVIAQIEFKFKDKKDLEKMFSIRDKFFLFSRESLWAYIHNMEILKTLAGSERSFYIKVYKHTLDFYLKKIFSQLNEPLVKAAQKLSLKKEDFPIEVGSTILEDIK